MSGTYSYNYVELNNLYTNKIIIGNFILYVDNNDLYIKIIDNTILKINIQYDTIIELNKMTFTYDGSIRIINNNNNNNNDSIEDIKLHDMYIIDHVECNEIEFDYYKIIKLDVNRLSINNNKKTILICPDKNNEYYELRYYVDNSNSNIEKYISFSMNDKTKQNKLIFSLNGEQRININTNNNYHVYENYDI